MSKFRPVIIVDTREKGSGVPEYIQELGGVVRYKQLTVADYVLSEECAVERKRVGDFINSLFSGRLFDQALRLSEVYKIPILVVEGNFAEAVEYTPRSRSLWGAIASLCLGSNIRVFYTLNERQTAELLYTIAKKRRYGPLRGPIPQRKKAQTVREQQLLIVSSLPGVGPKMADKLLRTFGTVRKVFSASKYMLSKVEGMSAKKAEKIVELLDARYIPESGEL